LPHPFDLLFFSFAEQQPHPRKDVGAVDHGVDASRVSAEALLGGPRPVFCRLRLEGVITMQEHPIGRGQIGSSQCLGVPLSDAPVGAADHQGAGVSHDAQPHTKSTLMGW
jgi:hypothetical protein